MKKIFSSFLSILAWPIRLFKKTRLDNFVKGLIFGALFSLLVNVVTVQVQERIQKQRVLEAIENEINLNMLNANNVLKTNEKGREEKTLINYFYVSPNYSADLWTQSAEPLLYTAQLDHETQASIMLYYSIIVKNANYQVNKNNNFIEERYLKCFDETAAPIESKKYECLEISNVVRDIEDVPATLIYDYSLETLKLFHPTKDRLSNLFLRIMMGSKSTRVLSGE